MRKATNIMLGAVLAVALASGTAQAAGKAGIGLEWGWAPSFQLGKFGLDMSSQEFTLAWNLSDSFQVGVFRGSGQYRGSYEYENDTVSGAEFDQEMTVTGSTAVAGLRFLTVLPAMNALSVGLEVGAMTLGTVTRQYVNSDGSAGNAAAFTGGIAPTDLAATAPLLGAMAKMKLIEAKSKDITAVLTVAGAFRLVDLPDTYVFGSQEVNTTETVKDKIDPVTNFHNVTVTAGLALWF
jgi:hypothetical protein